MKETKRQQQTNLTLAEWETLRRLVKFISLQMFSDGHSDAELSVSYGEIKTLFGGKSQWRAAINTEDSFVGVDSRLLSPPNLEKSIMNFLKNEIDTKHFYLGISIGVVNNCFVLNLKYSQLM